MRGCAPGGGWTLPSQHRVPVTGVFLEPCVAPAECGADRRAHSTAHLPGSPGPCPLPAGAPRSLSLLCAAALAALREWGQPLLLVTIIPRKNESAAGVLHERKFWVSALRYVGVMCWALPGNFHPCSPWATAKPGLCCCSLCLWGYRNWLAG